MHCRFTRRVALSFLQSGLTAKYPRCAVYTPGDSDVLVEIIFIRKAPKKKQKKNSVFCGRSLGVFKRMNKSLFHSLFFLFLFHFFSSHDSSHFFTLAAVVGILVRSSSFFYFFLQGLNFSWSAFTNSYFK